MTAASVPDESPETAGTVFAEFVKDAVAVEDQRRDSIESRARASITSSAALVSLTLAFATLISKINGYQLPGAARTLVIVAAIILALSALAAIGTAFPQIDRVIDPVQLARSLPDRWDWSSDAALKKVTATRLAQLGAAQRANTLRATMLLIAIAMQVLAIATLSAATAIILSA